MHAPGEMFVLLRYDDAVRIGEMLHEVGRLELMPRFRRLQDLQIREKTSAFDVVTEADEAAERSLADTLLRTFPGTTIIGEEATVGNAKALDQIPMADLAFIVDPLDGTK